jgi:hypothetical protein
LTPQVQATGFHIVQFVVSNRVRLRRFAPAMALIDGRLQVNLVTATCAKGMTQSEIDTVLLCLVWKGQVFRNGVWFAGVPLFWTQPPHS